MFANGSANIAPCEQSIGAESLEMVAVSAAEVVAAAVAAAVVQTADEPPIAEARVQSGDPAEVRDLLHDFVTPPWHRSHLAAPKLDHQHAERPGARVVGEAAAAAAADLAEAGHERGPHRHHCWKLSPASMISSISAASKLAW